MNTTTAPSAADTAAATPKTNANFAEIAEALRSHKTFVVISHVRPDGDALGSQIAMGLALVAVFCLVGFLSYA